jgi:hypothetical protein
MGSLVMALTSGYTARICHSHRPSWALRPLERRMVSIEQGREAGALAWIVPVLVILGLVIVAL